MGKIIDFKTGKEIQLEEQQPEITYDLQDYYNSAIFELVRCLMTLTEIPEEHKQEFTILLNTCLETMDRIIASKNNLI